MKHQFNEEQKQRKIGDSVLPDNARSPSRPKEDNGVFLPLQERVDKLLDIVNKPGRKATQMLFFVMYDITSNKVRAMVAKYLIKKGCFRIQRSIFLADLNAGACNQIKTDLAEVQASYDNDDSILIVPVTENFLNAMKIIGKDLNLDIILDKRNTLFF